MLLPTTLVGSYAQPEWLIDRAKLAGGETAEQISQVGANDRGCGYGEEVLHDGGLLQSRLASVGVISRRSRRLWRTPSP